MATLTRKQHNQKLAPFCNLEAVLVGNIVCFIVGTDTVTNRLIVRDVEGDVIMIQRSEVMARCVKCTANGVCAYLVAVDESESLVFAPFIGKEFYIVSNSNIRVGW